MTNIGWLRQGSTNGKAKMEIEGDHKNKKGKVAKGPTRARATLSAQEKKNFDLSHESEELRTVLGLLLKGQANLFQRMRIVESAVADCFHIPAICPLVDLGNAAYEGYAQYVRENPKSEEGPPGPQIYGAIMQGMFGMDVGQVNKTWITTTIQEMALTSSKLYATTVPFCRLRQCFDEDWYKLTIIITDTTTRNSFRKSMAQIPNVTHFTGPAPASAMEDSVSKWIQALTAN